MFFLSVVLLAISSTAGVLFRGFYSVEDKNDMTWAGMLISAVVMVGTGAASVANLGYVVMLAVTPLHYLR